MENILPRREARENAFLLAFSQTFGDIPLQENVKSAVQNMTNVTVSRVDLVIAGLAPAAEPQA